MGLETRWRGLEADAAGSFFLSWSWIGAFVATFADRADFHLFEWRERDDTIALALLDFGTVRRRRLFRVPVVMLNVAVDASADMCLEYNGLLARQGREQEAEAKLLEALAVPGLPRWDELQLRNLSQADFAAQGLRRFDDDAFTGWVADLSPELTRERVLERLSSNRRTQLRRSIKACEARGVLQVHEAADIETAQRYFTRLGELHNARWQRDGKAGAFESADWLRFHQAVIAHALPRGEIQLLRLSAGDTDLGYLYNFRWRDSIAMVQSGFIEPGSNADRPGFVCHLLAMEHNAARGATVYDFLGGDADYKRALGTRATTQANLRLQKPDVMSLQLEEWLVQGVRRLR